MDIEVFWQLIAESLDHAPGRVARQEYLTDRLAMFPVAEIVAFQALLDQTCDQGYSWDLWGAATRMSGGWCSDDGFEDFRLWLIGCGRAVFERVVAVPDALAGVDCGDGEWPEWESLDYVAADAYSKATGIDDECREEFYDAVESLLTTVTFRRDPVGERWDARDETAAVLKIPALSARFPLRDRSIGGS